MTLRPHCRVCHVQIDAHSVFGDKWDSRVLTMIADAPSAKPVITTYPPSAHIGDTERSWQWTGEGRGGYHSAARSRAR